MNKILFFILILLVSCQNSVEYSEFVSTENGWHKNKPATFSFEANDTISPYNLYLLLRNDVNYPFENIFLITKMEAPDNKVVTDTLEYKMATPEGKWLGYGISIKNNKLWYKENVKFYKKGKYLFSVEQADRKLGQDHGIEILQGITDVGLEIEKVQKK